MDSPWQDDRPLYRQLRERVVAAILERALEEGNPLPSVRTVAAEHRVNPLTVLKAYQQLADDGLVERRRGLGFFVAPGAHARLLGSERERFLREQWPRVQAEIVRLGLSAEELLASVAQTPAEEKAP